MKTPIIVPIIAGVLIALLLAPKKADAEFLSGNALLQRQTSAETVERANALGYVMGVFDVYLNVTFCAPTAVTAGQINDMIKNYLTNNPATRHASAESIINEAFKQIWPCKRANGKGGPV